MIVKRVATPISITPLFTTSSIRCSESRKFAVWYRLVRVRYRPVQVPVQVKSAKKRLFSRLGTGEGRFSGGNFIPYSIYALYMCSICSLSPIPYRRHFKENGVPPVPKLKNKRFPPVPPPVPPCTTLYHPHCVSDGGAGVRSPLCEFVGGFETDSDPDADSLLAVTDSDRRRFTFRPRRPQLFRELLHVGFERPTMLAHVLDVGVE